MGDMFYGDGDFDLNLDLDAGAEAFLRSQDSQRNDDLDFDFTDIAAEVAREVSQELELSGLEHAEGDFLPEADTTDGAMDLSTAQQLVNEQQTPQIDGSRVMYRSDDPAEVIALISSLKGVRHDYFASLRMQHILSRKRIRYVVVDVNKDVIVGRGLKNSELIADWKEAGLLQNDSEGRFSIPQCLIDGVTVGDDIDVQDLEEDCDLDEIINRTLCPECLVRREPKSFHCDACNKDFRSLIPEDLYDSNQIYIVFNDEPIGSKEPLPDLHQVIPYHPKFRSQDELRPDDW